LRHLVSGGVMDGDFAFERRKPWNKGKLVGQKTPFRPKEIWAIRARLSDGGADPGIGAFQPRDR